MVSKKGRDSLEGQAVFTFSSTHHALKAEKVLQAAQLPATIIPVPRRISSLCGLAIKLDSALHPRAEEILLGKGVKVEGVHFF
ncbi:MAG: DUF3343 domain-containing protein [Syntrophomonadaceae bacterium]|nr:DUF3343 domain-containing protein [Syntrophomonadaceae bacterium]